MARWGLAVVRGRSMLPTLADGDRLAVRHGARPRAGAVAVVVLPPTGVLAIKRLAFAEGVDSWSVGPVPASDVRAIAVCRVWPWWRGSGWRALRTRRR